MCITCVILWTKLTLKAAKTTARAEVLLHVCRFPTQMQVARRQIISKDVHKGMRMLKRLRQ